MNGSCCKEAIAPRAFRLRIAAIVSKLKILLQMSLVLVQGGQKRVTRVGRFAGQYAKPRSADTETRHGVTFPMYRGDMINCAAFTLEDRTPDPELLLRAYERSGLTINFIRALIEGGFADMHHPEYWELGFVSKSPHAAEYTRMVETIGESLRFIEALSGSVLADIGRVDFFTSHEGLHLLYEQAQTRQVPHRPGWYNLSTHMPWIGERTRASRARTSNTSAASPIPSASRSAPRSRPDEALALAEVLNPSKEPGRLTFIHRFGAERVARCLPPLVEASAAKGNRSSGVATPCTATPRPPRGHQDPAFRQYPARTGTILSHSE